MNIPCPECDQPLDRIGGDEMGSAPQRFRCVECQLAYERDPTGLLAEVEE